VAIWYLLWSFGTFFPVLVSCTKKNLASLMRQCAKCLMTKRRCYHNPPLQREWGCCSYQESYSEKGFLTKLSFWCLEKLNVAKAYS
jgi:hypothetical protein